MILLLFLAGFELQAQQVLPLYQNNSLKTYVTMPFRLQRTTTEGIPIVSVSLVDGNDSCQAMIDPNISHNFLIKCENPSTVNVDVYFDNSGVMQKIRYGPLTVAAISSSGVVAPPPVVGDPYLAGRTLYNAHCLRCHDNAYEKRGASISKINAAITTVGQMNSLNILTQPQIKAISDYLKSL